MKRAIKLQALKNSRESSGWYFENVYYTKLENLKEIDNFLDTYNIPKLNQNQINKLNRPITLKEIEAILKISQPKKVQGQMVSAQNSTRTSKKS